MWNRIHLVICVSFVYLHLVCHNIMKWKKYVKKDTYVVFVFSNSMNSWWQWVLHSSFIGFFICRHKDAMSDVWAQYRTKMLNVNTVRKQWSVSQPLQNGSVQSVGWARKERWCVCTWDRQVSYFSDTQRNCLASFASCDRLLWSAFKLFRRKADAIVSKSSHSQMFLMICILSLIYHRRSVCTNYLPFIKPFLLVSLCLCAWCTKKNYQFWYWKALKVWFLKTQLYIQILHI